MGTTTPAGVLDEILGSIFGTAIAMLKLFFVSYWGFLLAFIIIGGVLAWIYSLVHKSAGGRGK